MRALALVLSMLFAVPAWAACTGSSPTRTTDGNEKADVDECVTAASSGDTINVIAGDGAATWASAVVLPSSKDLTIIGPATVTCSGTPGTSGYSCSSDNALVITCNSGCFELNNAATQRISGFTMTSNNAAAIGWTFGSQASTSKHFRVDHNRLVMSPAEWEYVRPIGGDNGVHPQGVFDHNVFEGGSAVTVFGSIHYWNETGGAGNSGFTAQNILWAQQVPIADGLGTVFVEANYFTGGATNYFDHNHGSRMEARFNRLVGQSGLPWIFEIHGVQYDNRGAQWSGIYNNAVTGSTSGFSELRGGTGVYFNNSSSYTADLHLTIDRSEYDEPAGTFETVKECGTGGSDGNSPSGVDQQTTDQNGWRCRDQVGISHDASQWGGSPTTSPTSFNAWNQVTRPVYIWGNTNVDIVVNTQGDITDKIVVDREFYCDAGFAGGCNNGVRVGTSLPGTCTVGMAYWKTDEGEWNSASSGADGRLYRCSSTDTWTVYYTPYTYPHPWASGAGPPPPTNFRVR